MAPRFVAKQLSRPTGFGGRLIRMLMNRGNAALNFYAIEQLGLRPQDSALEIGFGGGAALARLIHQCAFVCGVDRSDDVVEAARRGYSDAVQSGRAKFEVGAVESLPSSDAAFDKVLSVNTVYFWEDLEVGAREIQRVLKPGGRVVLGFVPESRMDRMNMPADIFTPREPEDVATALRRSGLHDVELKRPDREVGWLIATAIRA